MKHEEGDKVDKAFNLLVEVCDRTRLNTTELHERLEKETNKSQMER